MTPKQLAQRARAEFRQSADPVVATGQRAYFKKWEKVRFHGIKTPEIRRIEREFHELIRKEWRYEDTLQLCELLMPDPYLESKTLALMLLMRYRRHFEPNLIDHAKRWLESGLCDNWAVTDHLATRIIGTLIDQFEPLAVAVEAWNRSPNLWVRRSSAVAFVNLARRGRYLDRAYRITSVLQPDTHDLIHKACGWLLRECGKTDSGRLEKYLLAQGSAIPRTTLRYAIEKFRNPRGAASLQPLAPTGNPAKISVMRPYQLAQINISRLIAPLDDPRIAGFVSQLAPVNALADASPGFVWRLQSESGNATDLAYNDDPFIIVNMSVWESVETLHEFIYRSHHLEVFRERSKWFEKMQLPNYCLWWAPEGHRPTIAEGRDRLEYYWKHGATPYAFWFSQLFPAPAEAPVPA